MGLSIDFTCIKKCVACTAAFTQANGLRAGCLGACHFPGLVRPSIHTIFPRHAARAPSGLCGMALKFSWACCLCSGLREAREAFVHVSGPWRQACNMRPAFIGAGLKAPECNE